ncbi:MAG: hypothetical protein E7599_03130 [Ruminococcaceae bacterium]|nr:hypothetical protein [Oscillospiraceae bacterium]
MDNKKNEQNGEISTEELIRRLMENFSDENEAEQESVCLPEVEGETAAEELLEFPVIDETTDEEAQETGAEKFKFRVQKSKVMVGAAIPKVSESLEGVIGEEEAEEPPMDELDTDAEPEVKEQEPVSEDVTEQEKALDDYTEMEQLAKDALEEESVQPEAEGVFSEDTVNEFGQLSEDDVNLMMIFGGENGEKSEGETDGAEDEKTDSKHRAEDEYDDPSKRDLFLAMFRRKYRFMKLRLWLAGVVLLLCGAVECVSFFGGDLPGMLSATKYPEIHLLISVQLTLFCVLVCLPEIISGIRTALGGCPGPGILLALGAGFNLAYEIMLAVSRNHVGTPTFNLPLALCALMAVLYSFLHLKSQMMAFDVISTDAVKYTATRQKDAESEMEKDAFDQYLDETPRIFGVQKTEFVTDFVANTEKYKKSKSVCGVIATVDVIVAVVFLILGYYRTGTLLDGLGYCQLALMFCLPVSAFAVFSFPYYRASNKAYAMDCAIVGDASVDEYADASVVSFNDSDVFPSSGVKVRSIKLYGNSRIDRVLYTVSGVFDRLGGPLADVFRQATKDFGKEGDVDVLEIKSSGVEAAVDGEHVYCGNGAYINACGYVPAYDPNDVAIEREGKLSIMFVVIGNELAAKMYIEYRMDPEMKDIVGALYKAGMCMGIRTLDPNIDDTMLGRRIRLTEYPVRVLKCESKEQLSSVAEKAKSGVASRKSAKNLLKTLSLCDRTQLLLRTGLAVKILSVLAGIVASSLVFAFGNFLDISSVHVLIYQLFWLLPAFILPALFI